MEVVNLIQGTQAWHDHRAKFFNASDAPVMNGCSKYKTRDDFLYERHTGIAKEHNAATQRLFDDGHAFEKLALARAEVIAGVELFPVVGVSGKYSASFDGISMCETIIYEHKTANDEIRAVFLNKAELPKMYRVQIEQQFMVSGAEKCLFMATRWINGECVDELWMWVYPDLDLRMEIVDGWNRFENDLANYVPVAIAEPVKAQPILALPSLSIAIKGEVTLSNLPKFQEAATAYIANISTELVTDEDFAQGAATITFCKEAEARIEATKAAAIAQTSSIDELMRTLDFIKAQFATKRLELDKLVKLRKEQIKLEALTKARDAIKAYAAEAGKEVLPIILPPPPDKLNEAIAGLKSLKSMHGNLNNEVAAAKILIDALARDVRGKLTFYNEAAKDYAFLFTDLQQIIFKPFDDFQLVVNTRISGFLTEQAERTAKASEVNPDVLQGNAEMPVEVKPVPVTEVLKKEVGNFQQRPNAQDIILLVSSHYGITKDLALQWICDLDFMVLNKPF